MSSPLRVFAVGDILFAPPHWEKSARPLCSTPRLGYILIARAVDAARHYAGAAGESNPPHYEPR
jgi:hypothetical protein